MNAEIIRTDALKDIIKKLSMIEGKDFVIDYRFDGPAGHHLDQTVIFYRNDKLKGTIYPMFECAFAPYALLDMVSALSTHNFQLPMDHIYELQSLLNIIHNDTRGNIVFEIDYYAKEISYRNNSYIRSSNLIYKTKLFKPYMNKAIIDAKNMIKKEKGYDYVKSISIQLD